MLQRARASTLGASGPRTARYETARHPLGTDRRARLVFAWSTGPACVAAQAVAAEVGEYLPALAERHGLDAALLLAALGVMPIDWQPPEVYEPYREEAERRIAGRDPEDWPTVALALARSLVIMRTTLTLDDDVVALIESDRARTGESFRACLNRLLRQGARAGPPPTPLPLPDLPGRPLLEVSDVSALLAALDDERRAQRDVP